MKRNKASQTKDKRKSKAKSDDEVKPKEEVEKEDEKEKDEKEEEVKEEIDEDEEEEEDEDEEDGEIDVVKNECLSLMHNLEYNEHNANILESYIRMYKTFEMLHASEKFFISKCKKLETHIDKKNNMIANLRETIQLDRKVIDNLTLEASEQNRLMDKVQSRNFQTRSNILDLMENFKDVVDKLMVKSLLLEEEQMDETTGKKKRDLRIELQSMIEKVGGLQKEIERSDYTNTSLRDQLKLLEDKYDRLQVERDEYKKLLISTTKEGHYLMNYLDSLRVKVDKSNRAYITLYKKWRKCKDILQPRIVKPNKPSTMKIRTCTTTVDKKVGGTDSKQSIDGSEGKDNAELEIPGSPRPTGELQMKDLEDMAPEIKELLDKCLREKRQMKMEIKEKDDELKRLTSNSNKFTKALEMYMKKLQVCEYQKGTVADERNKLKKTVIDLGSELQSQKEQSNADRKGMETLMKEREKMSENLIRSTGQVEDHVKMIKLQETIIKGLEIEMEQFVKEANKQRLIINALERDRDRLLNEIKILTEQVQDNLDEIQYKQTEIAEGQKKIAEGDAKFRLQQNLFESVRGDRNKFSKLFLESQDEVTELKHKLKIFGHQTEQLKEDISTKETQLIHVQDQKMKCNKEKENVKVELQNAKDDLVVSAKKIKAMYEEECKLKRHIQNADEKRLRLMKEMEQVMNERDILGSQLIRRNDELSLLYEKIRILQRTLNKGEAQYDQRLEDIRLLKLEIKRLRLDKTLLTRSLQNSLDLRRELKYLERDLTQERLKCRALEEELQTPLNIHRWRRLECTDPTSLELMKKIHLLQKRLLNQSSVICQKDEKIQMIERCYMELQVVIRNRPGPEVLEELTKTKLALRDKTDIMKMTIAELNMRDAEVRSYKIDIVRLKDDLLELKQKYFANKARLNRCQNNGFGRKLILPNIKITPSRSSKCGGGYNLSLNTIHDK